MSIAAKAAYDKERYAANRERLLGQTREYYAKNKERALARQRQYREVNRERIAAYSREHRKANREHIRASQKAWREANRDRRRDQWLIKEYGITLHDYDALLTSQNHSCKICRIGAQTGRWGVLHVDHDHTTGAIRGLLCANCNKALGGFQDNAELLEEAIRYLAKASGDA